MCFSLSYCTISSCAAKNVIVQTGDFTLSGGTLNINIKRISNLLLTQFDTEEKDCKMVSHYCFSYKLD